MSQKRILYLVPHRLQRSPGQRFRCEHFIPYLKQSGYKVTYSNILTKWDDKHFYSRRNYLIKLFIVIKSFIKRLYDLTRVRHYNAVFIYREAFMLGTALFEKIIKWQKVPIIYDFDDSIWLNDTSQGNHELKWLKRPSKTATICKTATTVIVGNSYLAQYAQQHNNNVHIVPTTIDTEYHKKKTTQQHANKQPVVIGWTGTSTTLKHLYSLADIFVEIKEKYGDSVQFSVIADTKPTLNNVMFNFEYWSLDNEIEQLSKFDIGIMPLPDNKWTRGKCGFKGLQYMALEIPAVMSPVGINSDIVIDGQNGFLPCNNSEWVEALSQLIENKDLRQSMGQQGRKTIETKFSVESNKDNYLKIIDSSIKH